MTVKTTHQFLFQLNQQHYSISYDTIGQGKPVLLLPAFSTVSSRSATINDHMVLIAADRLEKLAIALRLGRLPNL